MSRYENKFIINSLTENSRLNQFIKNEFTKTYNKRKINNIYFDSDNSSCLFQNLDGNYHKIKIRLRWYDEENIFFLELKGKKGSVGFKKVEEVFLKPDVKLDIRKIKPKRLSDILIDIPSDFIKFKSFKAVSFNSYSRNYFSNKKTGVRLTVDSSLSFVNLRIGTNIYKKQLKIVELKFKAKNNLEIAYSKLIKEMPSDISKFSKFSNSSVINTFY